MSSVTFKCCFSVNEWATELARRIHIDKRVNSCHKRLKWAGPKGGCPLQGHMPCHAQTFHWCKNTQILRSLMRTKSDMELNRKVVKCLPAGRLARALKYHGRTYPQTHWGLNWAFCVWNWQVLLYVGQICPKVHELDQSWFLSCIAWARCGPNQIFMSLFNGKCQRKLRIGPCVVDMRIFLESNNHLESAKSKPKKSAEMCWVWSKHSLLSGPGQDGRQSSKTSSNK